MKLRYISIPLHLESNKYLEKLGKSQISEIDTTLVYEIHTDYYFTSTAPATSYGREFVCNSEEQFQSLIAEHKLMEIL